MRSAARAPVVREEGEAEGGRKPDFGATHGKGAVEDLPRLVDYRARVLGGFNVGEEDQEGRAARSGHDVIVAEGSRQALGRLEEYRVARARAMGLSYPFQAVELHRHHAEDPAAPFRHLERSFELQPEALAIEEPREGVVAFEEVRAELGVHAPGSLSSQLLLAGGELGGEFAADVDRAAHAANEVFLHEADDEAQAHGDDRRDGVAQRLVASEDPACAVCDA